MKTKQLILAIFIFSITVASLIFIAFSISKNKGEIIEILKNELIKRSNDLDSTNNLFATAAHKRDSLTKVNFLLSKYRALTDAMSYRDSIRKPLEFKIGENVRMKRDSSHVLVDDIIVGGDKFSYYIKYIIEHKDKSFETVSPEKLFK